MSPFFRIARKALVALVYLAALGGLGVWSSADESTPSTESAASAPTTKGKRARGVIDLGQLEVEGEVRRPQVTWIDSQRRLRDQMPLFHQQEFLRIEQQLLAPLTAKELNARSTQ